MSTNKLKKRQAARLFSTLASIEQADRSATKRRKQSHRSSVRQSRAAADQTKINGILLELRILTQRCLTEQQQQQQEGSDGGLLDRGGNDIDRVKQEVDVLLENLLVARRDLMGHQLHGGGVEENEDVDYTKLIKQADKSGDGPSSSSGESSTDGDSEGDVVGLAALLQNEYTSLQTHWKSILNKHHSNLVLHSGMSVNNSKFQSRAVDVSFWEQVRGVMEHEQFKRRTSSPAAESTEGGTSNPLPFDDSKLYQQMLKDFISSCQSTGVTSFKTNKRGMRMDPAQEAAERLKRAMRKKSGADATGGDVDLTSLLTGAGKDSDGIMSQAGNAKKKAACTVDRRASKGRKIRYTVHPKLVNFTFPVARAEPMISDEIWFKSLFGGVGSLK